MTRRKVFAVRSEHNHLDFRITCSRKERLVELIQHSWVLGVSLLGPVQHNARNTACGAVYSHESCHSAHPALFESDAGQYFSRRRRLKSFPVSSRGSSVTNTTSRGTL